MTLATLRQQNAATGLPPFALTRATFQYLFLSVAFVWCSHAHFWMRIPALESNLRFSFVL
jgi:hypothetical protein